MKRKLAVCFFAFALATGADVKPAEMAADAKCVPPPPDKKVIIRPPIKYGDKIHEVNVYCGSNTNTQNATREPGDKSEDKPKEVSGPYLSILDALVRLLIGLAWPVAAVLLALLLRNEIATLLGRLRRTKISDRGIELEFEQLVREAEEVAEIEAAPQPVDAETMAEVAENPRAAILSSWSAVEAAMYRLLEARHLSEGYTRITQRPLTAIRLLQRSELLNSNYLGLFHNLRAMHSAVANAPDSTPSKDAVLRYVRLAGELVEEMDKKAAG